MIEVRFHGRAGQGMVTGAALLAVAAAKEGKSSQAFPFFGSEKRGPPVTSYCRIDEAQIKVYEQIYEPDIVIVADDSLLKSVDVAAGLKKDGILIINTSKSVADLKLAKTVKKVFTINGTDLAIKYFGKPIINTVMLGAFAKATGLVSLDSLKYALGEQFSGEVAEKNFNLVKECFEKVSLK